MKRNKITYIDTMGNSNFSSKSLVNKLKNEESFYLLKYHYIYILSYHHIYIQYRFLQRK